MSSEQEPSVIDRIVDHLPMISLQHAPFVWLALGTAHGAWLVEYGVVDGQPLIWITIAVAALAQLGGAFK